MKKMAENESERGRKREQEALLYIHVKRGSNITVVTYWTHRGKKVPQCMDKLSISEFICKTVYLIFAASHKQIFFNSYTYLNPNIYITIFFFILQHL